MRRRLLIGQEQAVISPSYLECIDARTYLNIPYSQKNWRFRVVFSYTRIAGNPNDVILSIGNGGVGFNRQGEFANRVKCVYYSSATLLQHVSYTDFEIVQIGKKYTVEFSYINDVLTCIIDGVQIYSYSDSRYTTPLRSIYVFNSITASEGSYSKIYEAQIYSDNSDSSIVYDFEPYKDPTNNYCGLRDKISGNTWTKETGLSVGY